MKYLVLIPDGMADRPFPALGGKTPMEVAEKPTMDELARKSYCATVLNVPPGMVPESDTANLAIMSYDPAVYSKGRSPETEKHQTDTGAYGAASIGSFFTAFCD